MTPRGARSPSSISIIAWRLLLTPTGRALLFAVAFAPLGRTSSSDSSSSESTTIRFDLLFFARAATGGGDGARASSSSVSDTSARVDLRRTAGWRGVLISKLQSQHEEGARDGP